jgi:hypothetical protein
MRIDLMESLKALNPSFLRIPGGNNLSVNTLLLAYLVYSLTICREGEAPPYHWKWNETIGPLKDRPGYPGTWGYENTNGLGVVEYFTVSKSPICFQRSNSLIFQDLSRSGCRANLGSMGWIISRPQCCERGSTRSICPRCSPRT